MSDYQPKVGDKVMLGKHGPYRVCATYADRGRTLIGAAGDETWVKSIWLTPAPEPEPDEPTAPSIWQDGSGNWWARASMAPESAYLNDLVRHVMLTGDRPGRWETFESVVRIFGPPRHLADPSEVEALREERDQWESDYQEAMRERDELQRRIDKVIAYCDNPGNWGTYENRRRIIASWLRGES